MPALAFAPTFPPLFAGVAVTGMTDPMHKAIAAATTAEPEPGLVHYAETDEVFRVALTLVPTEPLHKSARIGFGVMLGLSDALGALAPPEVAVHFVWPDGIKVNGAHCGALRLTASTNDAQTIPNWIVAALDLRVMATGQREPGARKDETTLFDEGCAEITVPSLIESWSRHSLGWINRYLDDGFGPLHAAWRGKCDSIGQTVTTPADGLFMGLDEDGGMILRDGDNTRTIALCAQMEHA